MFRRSPAGCVTRRIGTPSAAGAVEHRDTMPDHRLDLVLEPARLDGAVHSALLRRVRFPPPASAPGVLSVGHGAGAGDASEALETEGVAGMDRDVVRPGV